MNLLNVGRIGPSATRLVASLNEKARFTKEMARWLTTLVLLAKGGAPPGLIFECVQNTIRIAKAESSRSAPTKHEGDDTDALARSPARGVHRRIER